MPAFLLALRLPLTLSCAAIALACVTAFSRGYVMFPVLRAPSWEDVPALAAVSVFVVLSGIVVLAQAWSVLRQPSRAPLNRALPSPPRKVTRVAVLCLGLAVLAEGLLHLGANTGYWATGLPRFDDHLFQADGYVVWVDGQPLPADSEAFLTDFRVLARQPDAPQRHLSLPARSIYAFFVALVSPFVVPVLGLYVIFVAVNVVCWWLGAIATFDLARRAMDSQLGGLIAGLLVATGLGFTFMAGGATSHAAAYGLVPVVLWLAERLTVFDSDRSWGVLLLHAVITTAAGLTYSLLPYFLGSVVLYQVGRAPLSRLFLWSAATLLISQASAAALHELTGAAGTALAAGGVRTFAILGCVLLLAGLAAAVPRRVAERAVAAATLAVTVLAGVGLVVARNTPLATPQAVLAALQVPAYYAPRVQRAGETLSAALRDVDSLLAAVHQSFVDAHFPTAFAPLYWPLAVLGLMALAPRWRDWALAQVVAIALFAGAALFADAGAHPRLAYVAYPAVYVLTARGILLIASSPTAIATRLGHAPALAAAWPRVLAVALCVGFVLALAYPANASLLGNPYFDLRFHGIQP